MFGWLSHASPVALFRPRANGPRYWWAKRPMSISPEKSSVKHAGTQDKGRQSIGARKHENQPSQKRQIGQVAELGSLGGSLDLRGRFHGRLRLLGRRRECL